MSTECSERIRTARKAKGITQAQLAKAVGLGVATIQRYEAGDRRPNVEILADIADALDVNIDYLLGYESFEAREKYNQFNDAIKQSDFRAAEKALGLPEGSVFTIPSADIWAAGSVTVRPDYGKRLNAAFDKLNPDGQAEAVDRVEELTEIPKYQRTKE